MNTDKSITEEFLIRVKDFIEMEQCSCSMQIFTPEYIARNMQISIEDAKEALRLLKKRSLKMKCLKAVWQFCKYLFWPQWGKKNR